MVNPEDFPIAKVQLLSWGLLAALTVSGGFVFSWKCAEGIFIGGLLACVSFFALKHDLTRIFKGPLQAAKVRFFIKYYIRLSAVACILFVLIKYWHVNVFGLLAGLSTVVVSILVIGLSQMKKDYISA